MTSTFGCPHCGKSNPIDARFCVVCGTNLSDVDRSRLAQPPDAEEEIDETPSARQARQEGRSWPPSFQSDLETDQGEDSSPKPAPPQRSGLRRPSLRPQIIFRQPTPRQDPQPPTSETNLDANLTPSLPSDPRANLPQSRANRPESVDPTTWLERFSQSVPVETSTLLTDEMRRQLRQIFEAEVPLTDVPPPVDRLVDGEGLWRRVPIYLLLLVVLLVVLIFRDAPPETLPHIWPGVAPAFAAIEALPDGSTVLIDWAYDPATAGEMDLIVQPVVGHLLTQNANLVVVSQLPLGPATARRLIATAGTSVLGGAVARQWDMNLVDAGFLPGGAATLPLLAQAPILAVPVDLQGSTAPSLPPLASLQQEAPALVLIMADRFEPVQRWLEQVQPLNNVPVVAVTAAAPGPAVRPYLDSGQLVGLVSGYNGGIGYQELLSRPPNRAQQLRFWRQIAGHNWALVLFLIVIVVSNLAASVGRRAP